MRTRKSLADIRKSSSVLILPKTLRMLCMIMLLVGTLLIFVQDNYGHSRVVVLGRAAWDRSENVLVVNAYISWPSMQERRLELPSSRPILSQFDDFPTDTEFLIVLRRSGTQQVIERIFALEQPVHNTLSGPRWEIEPRMGIIVGSNPQLVEIIGLDRYIYQVRQPVWAREHISGNNLVLFQEDQPRVIKSMLDGNTKVFDPDIWLLDAGGRVTHVRRIGTVLFTWSGLALSLAFWSYGLACLLALLAVIMHYRLLLAGLCKAVIAKARSSLARVRRPKTVEQDITD